MFEPYPKRASRNEAFRKLCPLDRDEILRVPKQFFEPQNVEISALVHAVEVNVVEISKWEIGELGNSLRDAVLFEHNKRGACDATPDAERSRDPLHERSFARTQITGQCNHAHT